MSRYFVLIFLVLGIGVGALLSLVTDVNIFVNMIVGALAGAAVGYFLKVDRKSTRLNSSHPSRTRMPSSA